MNSRKPKKFFKRLDSSCFLILVVPCFNEESRWNLKYWESISLIHGITLYFINDGSQDQTSAKISCLTKDTQHVLITLPKNLGKAEAIRLGFQEAVLKNPIGIGFLDADGAFSIEDVRTQISTFKRLNRSRQNPVSVWSSRVQLAGRNIERKMLRHYIARILVTMLARTFKFKIYDTQSGMKIFPLTPTLVACIQKKFQTRWFIDLELYLRWRSHEKRDMAIWEEPVLAWRDVQGSKLSRSQYLTILNDLRKLKSYKTGSHNVK